jgi:hypothetical protein
MLDYYCERLGITGGMFSDLPAALFPGRRPPYLYKVLLFAVHLLCACFADSIADASA